MILLIDNYDSFVYNLAHLLELTGEGVQVVRNDKITIDEIKDMNPCAIVLSPGPKDPNSAGLCLEIISKFKGLIPILGVCLGHQAIGQFFGGKVRRANTPFHGKTSLIKHNGKGIFKSLASPLKVARYHSLIVDITGLSSVEICAQSDEGEVMGLCHTRYLIFGVQFHPESFLSECGQDIINNFIAIAKGIPLNE